MKGETSRLENSIILNRKHVTVETGSNDSMSDAEVTDSESHNSEAVNSEDNDQAERSSENEAVHSSENEAEHSSENEAKHSSENEAEHSSENEAEHSSENEAKHSSENEAEHSSENEAEHSSENEAEHSSENESENAKVSEVMKNEGWADSVAKILGTNKPKNKKTLVLSRAKKHSEVVKKEPAPEFDIVGEDKPKVQEIKTEADLPPKKKIKIEHPTPRVKPNILEKDRERVLAKIATKGVVQLFNAVKNQQNTFDKELNETGLSEGKREKILKKFDKRTFLDTLMGQTKSTIVEDKSRLKDEVKEEETPKWNALRDDFMTGAKLKDWDKTIDED